MISINFEPLSNIDDLYPLPIAQTYRSLALVCAQGASRVERFLRLKDCFETVSRYLALALVAVYVNSGGRNTETDRSIIRKLVRPSTGDWPTLVAELAPLLADIGHPLASEMYRTFFVSTERAGRKPHRRKQVMSDLLDFSGIRNEYLGHGLTRQASEYESIVDKWGRKINNILLEANFLTQWDLIYSMGVSSGEKWMGHAQPEYVLSFDRDLPSDLAGRFLLVKHNDIVDLNPFMLRLRCPNCNAIRLCVYDSQHKYTDVKKTVRLVEFPEAHRFSSSEPISQLEAIFGSSLLKQEYISIYAKLREVEGRILDQSKLIEEHADIVGRSFLDEQIDQFLSDKPKGIFLLTGQPGIGKTAYLSNYVKQHTRCPYFFFSRASGFTSLDDAAKSIYYQILELLDRTDLSPAENASEQFVKLRNLLMSLDSSALAKATNRLVIVLDAIDEATTSSMGIQPLDLLSIDLPDSVYFLISSRESSTVFRLSTRSNVSRFHINPTSEENLRDAEDYASSRLGRYKLDADLLRRIAGSSEGNFLILEHIVGNLLVLLQEEPEKFHSTVKRLIHHPSGSLDDFYAGLWDQIIHSRESDVEATRAIVDVMGLLSIAKSPLRSEDLALILGQRQFETDMTIERLRPFLEIRSEETERSLSTFYRLYHSTFADYVRERVGHDIRRYHLALIKYCQQGEPEGYLERYCSEHLPQHIVESESSGNVVSQRSFEGLRPLLSREIALVRRKVEGSYSGFIRDVDRAIELSRQGGLQTFPELLEFCFIKSHVLTAMGEMPIDTFAALLILDGIERAIDAVESMGDKGHKAQAYASLSLVCPDDSKKQEFVQKALELARHSGGTWEIAENLSHVGKLLVNKFPVAGVGAIRDAFEIIEDRQGTDWHISPEITAQPIESLIEAYENSPNELAPILPRVVQIVTGIASTIKLLDLACAIFNTSENLANSILDDAWQELEKWRLSAEQSGSRNKYSEWELRNAQVKYIEVLTMTGKQNLAEARFPELARGLNLSELKKAIDLLNNGDYARALSHSDHPPIRCLGLRGLLRLGETEKAITIVKQNPGYTELDMLIEFAPQIVNQGVYPTVLEFAHELQEKPFSRIAKVNLLKAAIARELSYVEPELARSIVEEFHSGLSSRWEIPRWGDFALIAAVWYRKGENEAKRHISSLDFDGQEGIKGIIGGYLKNIKRWDQWKTSRSAKRKTGPDIPPNLKRGWELLEQKRWEELREWIGRVRLNDWKHRESKVELVKALVEAGQKDLAWLMASKGGNYFRSRAQAQIESVSLRNGVDIDGLSMGTDDVEAAIIKAKGLAHRSEVLACSYVRLLGDWLLVERQADDLLAWGLSRIALFLYQHDNSAEAKRYFLLGYKHWVETEEADMRADIQHELTEFVDELPFLDRFSILQEMIAFCSSRKPKDIVQFVSMFADALVLNFSSSEIERILSAIKRSRDWMIVGQS
jgi:hypothetical protein